MVYLPTLRPSPSELTLAQAGRVSTELDWTRFSRPALVQLCTTVTCLQDGTTLAAVLTGLDWLGLEWPRLKPTNIYPRATVLFSPLDIGHMEARWTYGTYGRLYSWRLVDSQDDDSHSENITSKERTEVSDMFGSKSSSSFPAFDLINMYWIPGLTPMAFPS